VSRRGEASVPPTSLDLDQSVSRGRRQHGSLLVFGGTARPARAGSAPPLFFPQAASRAGDGYRVERVPGEAGHFASVPPRQGSPTLTGVSPDRYPSPIV